MDIKKEILFLGNYTQDFVVNSFKQLASDNEYKLNVHITGFNQYRQDILNTESQLYKIKPDILFLSIDLYMLTEDIVNDPTPENDVLFKERITELFSLLKILNENLSKTQLFIDNFFYYRPNTMATVEYNSVYSYKQLEDIANLELFETVKSLNNANIIDIRSMIIQKGAQQLFDDRMYYLARSHWSKSGLDHLANLYLRYLMAFTGASKKCIVLDIDNTLWGGIIGDDGIENIKLSHEGEGKAFYDFQRELLKLYNRGILLAINSMNTKEIVLETMNNHPDMILKPEHFVCIKIDWRNKAQKMAEIAEEINLDFNSFVFLDDSDFERGIISREFPEIFVPTLPKDYADYPNFIRSLNAFDCLNITNDDFNRNKIYKANTERESLQKKVIDIEEFYYSLDMRVNIGIATSLQVPRIAQMTQKTNQFNLRTIRYTDVEIMEFINNPNFEVYYLSLSDKFGDNGIVGTAILRIEDKKAFIDSFLFSCRALGRTAETALINFIINDFTGRGLEILEGEYIKTKKNLPCKDFYSDHFFKKQDNKWVMELNNNEIKAIPWIMINN